MSSNCTDMFAKLLPFASNTDSFVLTLSIFKNPLATTFLVGVYPKKSAIRKALSLRSAVLR